MDIQPKMPDLESMNPDPKHCFLFYVTVGLCAWIEEGGLAKYSILESLQAPDSAEARFCGYQF
jgi:hypothetical protein